MHRLDAPLKLSFSDRYLEIIDIVKQSSVNTCGVTVKWISYCGKFKTSVSRPEWILLCIVCQLSDVFDRMTFMTLSWDHLFALDFTHEWCFQKDYLLSIDRWLCHGFTCSVNLFSDQWLGCSMIHWKWSVYLVHLGSNVTVFLSWSMVEKVVFIASWFLWRLADKFIQQVLANYLNAKLDWQSLFLILGRYLWCAAVKMIQPTVANVFECKMTLKQIFAGL